MNSDLEQEGATSVRRHGAQALARHPGLRPEVLRQTARRARMYARMFQKTVGLDLAAQQVLDVGCGTGGFLRQLIDWGADPANLTGTDLSPERLALARRITAPGVHWHLGGLDGIPDDSVDLVTAHTVFSSIPGNLARQALAVQMWRVLRPGGWCMMVDLRHKDPCHPDIRKLGRAELDHLWPGRERYYRSLLLAPPLARMLVPLPRAVPELLGTLIPPLRSHFVFMARKDGRQAFR